MSNKNSDSKPKKQASMAEGPAPPPLSEELIAQLQGAVRAAQRKRMPKPAGTTQQSSTDEEF